MTARRGTIGLSQRWPLNWLAHTKQSHLKSLKDCADCIFIFRYLYINGTKEIKEKEHITWEGAKLGEVDKRDRRKNMEGGKLYNCILIKITVYQISRRLIIKH